MSRHILQSHNFTLSLQLQVFETDIAFPSNTIMSVSVESDEFCATVDMDVDIKEMASFSGALVELYTTLRGIARIQEPYGCKQFIAFSGDGKGHIFVAGVLHSFGRNGFEQELKFENMVDQTSLNEFAKQLYNSYAKYLSQ